MRRPGPQRLVRTVVGEHIPVVLPGRAVRRRVWNFVEGVDLGLPRGAALVLGRRSEDFRVLRVHVGGLVDTREAKFALEAQEFEYRAYDGAECREGSRYDGG